MAGTYESGSAKALEQLERDWELSKELGMANEDLYIAEKVGVELRFSADYESGLMASELVYQWRKTRNPSYIDLLIKLCQNKGVAPTETVLQLIFDTADRRLEGKDSGGTPDKIKRESNLQQCLIMMANLIFYGQTLSKAASQTAQYMLSKHGRRLYKASSLMTKYKSKFRHSKSVRRYEVRYLAMGGASKYGEVMSDFDLLKEYGCREDQFEQVKEFVDSLPGFKSATSIDYVTLLVNYEEQLFINWSNGVDDAIRERWIYLRDNLPLASEDIEGFST